jgi:MFS family permease
MLRPVGGVTRHVRESAAAFAAVMRNADLRRLELAWAGSIVGHWTYLIAISIYAYGEGGEEAVGVLFFVRLVPAALVSPFAALLADRYPRARVMLVSDLIRAVLIGLTAAGVLLDAPPALIYALAVATVIAMTPFRPAQVALTPSLARTPAELIAANAAATTSESLGYFVGPALAGLLLAVTSVGVTLVITACFVLWSAYFILRIRASREPEHEADLEASTILSESVAGFRTVAQTPDLRVLIGAIAAQTLVAGALQVLIIVVAIEVVDVGESGVGFLYAVFGVGALCGAVVGLSLAGVRRLSIPFMIGAVLWSAPLVLLGLWPSAAAAVIMLWLVGLGTFVDVAGFTLIQRIAPEEVLARVFGVLQMLWLGSVGIGALIAPWLVSWLGPEGALIATGLFLLAVVMLLAPRILSIDAAAKAPEAEELRLLASIPIFAPLPGTALEHLTARLIPLRVEPGTVIVRQGDPGDRFYLIAEGEVDVSADGQPISELGAGDYFGEIALLRDMPRTATVTARSPVVLYGLEREDFLSAVTGHPSSTKAAETVVSSRLAGLGSVAGRLPVT